MNKKGFAQIPILIAIAVGALVIGGLVRYITTDQVQPPEELPTKTQIDISETVNWVEYKKEEFGFKFKYPQEYSNPQTGWNWGDIGVDVHMAKSNNEKMHIVGEAIEGISCMSLLCNAPTQTEVVTNSIAWDYLGIHSYCDVGQCSPERSVYRTEYKNVRYYFLFENESSSREELILSTFQFIDSSLFEGPLPTIKG